MPSELLNKALDQLSLEIYDLYGPTETSVYSTFYRCLRDDKLPTVHIGRPIANTSIHLFDSELNF